MGFRFDGVSEKLRNTIGKDVHFVFADGDEMDAKIVGYTSELDNPEGIASVEVKTEKLKGLITVFENEIETMVIK